MQFEIQQFYEKNFTRYLKTFLMVLWNEGSTNDLDWTLDECSLHWEYFIIFLYDEQTVLSLLLLNNAINILIVVSDILIVLHHVNENNAPNNWRFPHQFHLQINSKTNIDSWNIIDGIFHVYFIHSISTTPSLWKSKPFSIP